MKDQNAPLRATVFYALLIFLVRCLDSQTTVLLMWYGRRAYERSRGEMIIMLYEKMLTRKVVGLHQEQGKASPKTLQGSNAEGGNSGASKDSNGEEQSASAGKVLNLMR